jgi:stress response protein YsnF
VDLQKQARVAEEVVVSKEAEQRTEQVSGTVRREEVFVDEDAEVDASIARDRGTGANPTI